MDGVLAVQTMHFMAYILNLYKAQNKRINSGKTWLTKEKKSRSIYICILIDARSTHAQLFLSVWWRLDALDLFLKFELIYKYVWLHCVLGRNSALVRLYWADDNLG